MRRNFTVGKIIDSTVTGSRGFLFVFPFSLPLLFFFFLTTILLLEQPVRVISLTEEPPPIQHDQLAKSCPQRPHSANSVTHSTN